MLNQFKKYSLFEKFAEIFFIFIFVGIGIVIPIITYYEYSKTIEFKKQNQNEKYFNSILNLNITFLSFLCLLACFPSAFRTRSK